MSLPTGFSETDFYYIKAFNDDGVNFVGNQNVLSNQNKLLHSLPFPITDEIYNILLDESYNTENILDVRDDIINYLNQYFNQNNKIFNILNTNYVSGVEDIADKILEYYKSLCNNKQKGEKYMSMINNETVNKELYKQSIENYHKQYADILNISGGICLIIIIFYKIINMKE